MSSGRIPDGPPAFAPVTFSEYFGACSCHDSYRNRGMTDPSCRRCEYQDEWYWMVSQAVSEIIVSAEEWERS